MSGRSLESLIADPERQVAARALLRETLDAEPTTLAYLGWAGKLPEFGERRTVAVLSSFTVETLRPYLEVEAYVSGWRAEPVFYQYSQWQNALLDPAVLAESEPQACVLFLHGEALLPPGREDQAGAVFASLAGAVKALRSRLATPLFLGLIAEPPAIHALALGEAVVPARARALVQINDGLAGLAAELDDVYLLDIPAWAAAFGDGWFDRAGALSTLSVVAHGALPALARGLARSLACLFRARRKVLVVDLDNTLWGGIVGEDGVDGVRIGETWPGSAYVAFQHMLRALRASGVLLAIASRNEEADARAVFEQCPEMVLRWDDFSAHRINWRDKPVNLIEIADELGVGLDSLVFADDDPMECAQVREILPVVEVVGLGGDPSAFPDRLFGCQAFDTLAVTAEDMSRADGYLAEKDRRGVQIAAGDLDEFLASIDLRLRIRPADGQTVDRIHQLIRRTNQFNLSLERLPLETVRRLAREPGNLYCAALSDRFGDYGVIGVVHLKDAGPAVEIANMVISCRALGRRVEDALLAFASAQAEARCAERLVARFTQGPRNGQVQDVLGRYGFAARQESGDRREYVLDLCDGAIPWPQHIEVELPAAQELAS